MDVISLNGSAVTSLFSVARPQGAPPILETAKALVERYKFATFPKLDELFSDKLIFQNGIYDGKPIDAFEVYSDGVVIRGRCNTDVLDSFHNDVAEWFFATSAARRVETHTLSTTYESNLTVIASDKMLAALEVLSPACATISKFLAASTGALVDYAPFGFSLAIEEARVSGVLKPGYFKVERKVGLEYNKGYFVSIAPVRTNDHIKLLEMLDR